MKIDTLGLQAFVAIAEQAGFQKAADTLHITQTALTRRLQNFEALLGVKLIERTTRSVAMTQLGSDFLPQARRMLSDLEYALTEIEKTGSAHRGDVSIACVPTVGVQYLPRIIQEYAARYPENRIKILDHASSGVANAVIRREAEFGINIGGPHHPELTSVPLLQDRFVVICRDDHPLAKRRTVSWRGQRQSTAPRCRPGNAERSSPVSVRGPAQLDRSRPRRARRGGRGGAEPCDPERRVSSDQGDRAQ
jgi:DNA-binding transcriptional LysR family regulator